MMRLTTTSLLAASYNKTITRLASPSAKRFNSNPRTSITYNWMCISKPGLNLIDILFFFILSRSIIISLMSSEPLRMKLVVVGDGTVGKTCILLR